MKSRTSATVHDFIDFAFIRGHVRLAIEIDGYGPHLQKITRSQFSDQWIRQNHLMLDGWKLLRFSFDDVKDKD
jgi:very-short-patch-repair endonuclease